jgi:hypothetical protein
MLASDKDGGVCEQRWRHSKQWHAFSKATPLPKAVPNHRSIPSAPSSQAAIRAIAAPLQVALVPRPCGKVQSHARDAAALVEGVKRL